MCIYSIAPQWLYEPILHAIKEIFVERNQGNEIAFGDEKEVLEYVKNYIHDELKNFYSKKDYNMSDNKCINIPIALYIDRYNNTNMCKYKNISEINIEEMCINDKLKEYLFNVNNNKEENDRIKNEFIDKVKEHINTEEEILKEYIIYLCQKMIDRQNSSRKIRKNDIVDMSIVSSAYMEKLNKQEKKKESKYSFITFDKLMYDFIKEKGYFDLSWEQEIIE